MSEIKSTLKEYRRKNYKESRISNTHTLSEACLESNP